MATTDRIMGAAVIWGTRAAVWCASRPGPSRNFGTLTVRVAHGTARSKRDAIRAARSWLGIGPGSRLPDGWEIKRIREVTRG